MTSVGAILLLVPFAFTAFAAYMVRSGLRESARITWSRTAIGVCAMLISAFAVFALSKEGGLGGVLASIWSVSAASAALLGAIWMAMSLPGWRKAVALAFFPLLPALLFIGIQVGYDLAPVSKTERAGDAILEALNRYHDDIGAYPEALKDLEPDHIGEVPAVFTYAPQDAYKGWLYARQDGDFMLGYVEGFDGWVANVCFFGSASPVWECEVWPYSDWGPLPRIPPTPQPTRQPSRTDTPA